MAQLRLNRKLLDKIASKLGRRRANINVRVSKKASKLGISSEVALIILAKELGIGTATYQRSLDPAKQTEVRDTLPTFFAVRNSNTNSKKQKTAVAKSHTKPQVNKRVLLKSAIEYLIQDQELKDRCEDILLASSKFDRPINQATLVLEDRIRKKSQPTKRSVGENLVNYACNGDLSKTVLKISDNPDEQKGYTDMLRGVMLAFRNKTHHHVINTFTREEALRICGYIDVLLRVIDGSVKIK